MNTEISKRRQYQRFTVYLIAGLLVNTILSLSVAAQIGRPILEAPALCNISVYDDGKIDYKKPTVKNGIVSSGKLGIQKKNFQLKANRFGIFPRITVRRAFESVTIEMIYPNAKNGEKVVL